MKRLPVLMMVVCSLLLAVNVPTSSAGNFMTISDMEVLLAQSGDVGGDIVVQVYGVKGVPEPEGWKCTDWANRLHQSYSDVIIDNPANLKVSLRRLVNIVNMAHFGTRDDSQWQNQLVTRLVILDGRKATASKVK
jgi:hypothetical protein